MNSRKSLGVLLSLLLVVAANSAQETIPATAPSTNVNRVPKGQPATLATGATAPDFPSQDLARKEVRLSGLKDKVVVLDFWATWCGPCKAALPHMEEVAKQYKDQGVVVVAVCTSDTRANFREFVKANQDKYPDIVFTCDPNERGSATVEERASFKHYGVRGFPTQFVVGRDGKVVRVMVGYPEGDVRLEASLARAGIKVDPAVAAEGEAQFKKEAL